MAHMLDLQSELLNIILTFLMMSSDDIKDWAYVSAICKEINIEAQKPEILRLIDFKSGIGGGDFERHFHISGLLSKCVQAENVYAQCIMGLFILYGGAPLWEKMLENRLTNLSIRCATSLPLSERRGFAKSLITGSTADIPYIMFTLEDEPQLCAPYGHLHPLKLVSLLLCIADPEDIMSLSSDLKDFNEFFVGYHKYTKKGKPIAEAVLEFYEEDKLPDGSVEPYISQIVSAIDNQLKQETS